MSTPAISTLQQRDDSSAHERFAGQTQLEMIVLRLDGLPATGENRRRIQDRVEHLNRALANSGVPFRLRLL